MNKRNPLMPLYVGIIMIVVGLQGTLVQKDYVSGVIALAVGAVLIALFYWRQRKRTRA